MAIADQYRIRLNFGKRDRVAVFDLSALLWDLNRIYVVGYEAGAGYGGNPSSRGRGRYRLIENEDQLLLARIRFESPLLVELINQVVPEFVGVMAGIWALAQSLDKLVQLAPTSRKLKADAAKAELEVHRTKLEIRRLQRELERMDREQNKPSAVGLIEQSPEINSAMRQLHANPLQPLHFDIFPSREDRF